MHALRNVLTVVATALLTAQSLAGPPLLCHSIKVDEKQSLPWGEDAFAESKSYDRSKVVGDTLELLRQDTPVLTRMETLRRAALYVDHNQARADALLGKLMARALDSESAKSPDAMAWFDAGYFAQCLHQSSTPHSFGPSVTKGVGASAIEGYSWVSKALSIAGSNADMEMAAALMTADHRIPEHEQHLKQAIQLKGESLTGESKRLLSWIAQINGQSLEQLRAKYSNANARADH